MKKLIFDFDGTLVASGPLIYASLVNYTAKSHLTWSQLRDLPSTEVVSALGISKLDLPKLILKVRTEFKSKLFEQPIISGIAEALRELKQFGHSLHIVSSNSEENISEFLKIHGIRELFDDVTSFFTIFGKAHGIEKLLSKLRCELEEAIYIGDETRDIEAAKKVGIKSLAVTWGYNSERVLTTFRPDYIAKTPEEMVVILCENKG